ncbi:Transcription initiation factor IIE subunit beta [Armadillidium nasatum]|uniref:Transcription initiation factor IIE subunit beta n=1 Tax=Armadillidium nasatum TaxID=96803 RepID=A0A5N5TLC1_9CRUS|nr:Transcription initiation factor IIE subunit beta [Armadillidium nasatum]
MDKALLKERELFSKRALANLSVETRKRVEPSSNEPPKKKSKPASGLPDVTSYKSMSSGSQFKFGVLARIVRHMRTRHQDGEVHPLSIDEILDETNQLNIGQRVKQWLISESLPNNPKISDVEGKYIFKPPLPVRDKKSLLKLLRQHDMKGLGGVMLDDIQESVPHYEKVMKGIKSMQDTGPKPLIPIRKKSKARKQRAAKISDNEHLAHVLKSYDEG